jgi:magnesium transporter
VLVDCAAYTGGCRVADVRLDELDEWLAKDDTFVWVGLYEPSEEELRTVQAELGLHDLAIEDAHRAHQRPKLEEYGDSLFVVLRTAQWDEAKKVVEKGETHLFVGKRYVVSVRHGKSPSYSPVRIRCQSAPHLLAHGTDFVLYAIMDFVVDHYFPLLDELEDEVESLEKIIFSDKGRSDVTRRIYRLKRQMLGLKRAVSPLVEVCNRLVRFDSRLVGDETRPYFRDVYDHVLRINETADGLRELLTSALEANLALVGIRQNEVMKGLAAWAAILALPTMMAGIWGMNFEGMPELREAWGYPAALAAMFGGAGVLFWNFRRIGWL